MVYKVLWQNKATIQFTNIKDNENKLHEIVEVTQIVKQINKVGEIIEME